MTKNESAYISKYALTQGIIVCTEGRYGNSDGGCFYWGKQPGWYMDDGFTNKEAHRTLEEAMAAAEEMRKRKIKSLEKQLERLRGLEIKVAGSKEVRK